jgi:hypothetical protein
MALGQQPFAKVGANKAGTSGYEDAFSGIAAPFHDFSLVVRLVLAMRLTSSTFLPVAIYEVRVDFLSRGISLSFEKIRRLKISVL